MTVGLSGCRDDATIQWVEIDRLTEELIEEDDCRLKAKELQQDTV